MVQIKPQDADRFLSRPNPDVRVVLIHGSDTGLVSERAAQFVKTVLGKGDDPFALVRLDSAEIAADPGRLADEANTIALFGGTRAIWVRLGGNRPIQAAVEAVLAAPPQDAWVVIEAGDLKKGTGLRKVCENARGAAAIACYADNDMALDRLIDGEVQAAGLTIEPDARNLLRGLLGSDRLASRSEIAKLCLYARGERSIDIAAVRAIVGDAGASATDEAVDAMALGDVKELDVSFRRLVASGTAAFVIAAAALRHFQMLHRIAAAIDNGATSQAAIDGASGGLFFQRKAKLEQQVRLWTLDRLTAALDRLDRAILDSRLKAAIADSVIAQALLGIATLARQPRR
ncbi:DNA polymerase III subunit delta [Kaistia dalseonensis]|uniref:DNA-directed DNA polymerase n=1 Tax=Kaistia dalseonensis TaxID=410840 RepID=A0ABU0H7D0_9HYPH|nr:DNA polymerase III subunit delta [Kaistia dalseonensis]MCX5494800.1 DNA polymerase III subunit delta [Kaistia dalseonensis]MDQ0437381.1 DNA polymerase-3 subunit delta [Kaistia dalseonensis]